MTQVSRNAPCPCGSGKKYKKCCLRKAEAAMAWDYVTKKHLIKSSDDFPIHRCYINPNWKESGLARIVVTRSQENGKLILGVFLVDIFCLGVKNAFCNADVSMERFEADLFSKCYSDQEPDIIGIHYVSQIIFGAMDYARKLGFEPHEDFTLARYVLGTEKPGHDRNIQFGGPNGKPLYVSGPDDDARRIFQKLKERLGEGGFEFVMTADVPGKIVDN